MAAEKSPLFYCKKNCCPTDSSFLFYSDSNFSTLRCLADLPLNAGSNIL